MPRLTWRNFSGGLWLNGPRENNPPGTLRRASAVFPTRSGSLRSRSGIVTFTQRVAHSLFKYNGRRIAGIAAQIWREVSGVWTQLVTGVPTLTSGARLTFVSAPPVAGDQDSVFVAGGGNLFKINPALDTASQWGITPPSGGGFSASLLTQGSTAIDSFDDSTTWAGTTVNDDDTTTALTLNTDTNKFIQGTASLRFFVPKDTTNSDKAAARVDKAIVANLALVGGNPSGDEDFIELY